MTFISLAEQDISPVHCAATRSQPCDILSIY